MEETENPDGGEIEHEQVETEEDSVIRRRRQYTNSGLELIQQVGQGSPLHPN